MRDHNCTVVVNRIHTTSCYVCDTSSDVPATYCCSYNDTIRGYSWHHIIGKGAAGQINGNTTPCGYYSSVKPKHIM